VCCIACDLFCEFTEIWGDKYPAIVRLWENAWTEFAPFLDYSVELTEVAYVA
jgi:transposase-like protein